MLWKLRRVLQRFAQRVRSSLSRKRDQKSTEKTRPPRPPIEYGGNKNASNHPSTKKKGKKETGLKGALDQNISFSPSPSPSPLSWPRSDILLVLTFALQRNELCVALPITNQKCEHHLRCSLDELINTATHEGGVGMNSVDALDILATFLIRNVFC